MDELIKNLKKYFDDFETLWNLVNKSSTVQITNREQRNQINYMSAKWFSDYAKSLSMYNVSQEVLDKYNGAFEELLKLSSTNSRRSSYLRQMDIIRHNYTSEIIIFLQTHTCESDVVVNKMSSEVLELLDKIQDKEENEYLCEALGCWENGFYKAAVVLMWCAAIDRIHRAIENVGFDKFNSTSEYMKNQTTGRFKRFNKNQNVHSISELRMVFDSDILAILEGMEMIDVNQKTRLVSCFEMRCHSGHPGEAPITKYNVLSCFSDIVEIIFANSKFSLQKKEGLE